MTAFISTVNDFLSGPAAHNIYWFFAVTGSVFFLFSLLTLLTGFGGMSDDMDGDGIPDNSVDTGFSDLRLISFRTVFAFFTLFGWGGVLFGNRGWIGLFIALAAGTITMVLAAYLIMGILKLQQSGTLENASLVGQKGVVYFRIPGGAGKYGKVTLELQDCTREIMAFSDESLETGVPVKVLDYSGNGSFKVVRQ